MLLVDRDIEQDREFLRKVSYINYITPLVNEPVVSDLSNHLLEYNHNNFEVAYTHSQSTHAPSDAEKNVNADWTAVSGPSVILNKPIIPTSLSDLISDSTHRLVTDAEKSSWNAKSNFSGSYTDLTNKPTIPVVDNTAYGVSWDGNVDAPTKNAVYDKIESLSFSSGGLSSAQVLAIGLL